MRDEFRDVKRGRIIALGQCGGIVSGAQFAGRVL
jgi:hypothetical protein